MRFQLLLSAHDTVDGRKNDGVCPEQLASAFGWNGHHVTRAEDFAGVLRTALDEDGPSLVVAPVDYRENMLLTERLGEIVSPTMQGG